MSVLILLALLPTPCLADPVFLLLKALGPIPLSFFASTEPSYQLYDRSTAQDAEAKSSAKHAPLVETYLYDSGKFDDLNARCELYQSNRELSAALQLQNGPEAMAPMTKVMNEYFRRVYQSYSSALVAPPRAGQVKQDTNLLGMGRNLIASYQPFRLSEQLEARLRYDVIGHSSHLMLVSPLVEFEATYYSIDQKSPAAIPEHVVFIDDALDQFARYERFSMSIARTFSELGMRLKARYCALSGTLDYGLSKSYGPLALQLVREENHFHDLPDSLTLQLTFSVRL